MRRSPTFGWELREKDRSMTFRHLGAMTSGYARPEPPGAAWSYNDYAIQLYQKTLFDQCVQGAARASRCGARAIRRTAGWKTA